MISVQNRLQLLSGSKKLVYIVLFSFALQSCGIFGGGKKSPTPPPPVVVDESKPKPTEPEPTVVEPIDTKPVDVNVPTEPVDTIKKTTPVLIKEEVNLAVILPFQLDKADAGTLTTASKNSLRIYKGIQYALNEQSYPDKNVNVYVFDNNASPTETQAILNQQPFPKVDAVIGPLYTKNIQVVADYAKANKIPFISPLSSSEKLAMNNPYVISANATKQTRYDVLLKYIKKEFINPNVSVIYQSIKNDVQTKNEVVTLAKQNKIDITEQISEGREMFSVAENVLEKGRENVIILPTDDNEEGKLYIERMLQYLNSLSKDYSINVVATSEWNGVTNFDANAYTGINFLIIDRYFVNETDARVNTKVNQLKTKNDDVNLHIYTLQGYDIMTHLGILIQLYGNKFPANLSQPYQGIQTTYRFNDFKQNGQTYFVDNKSINILKYQNGRWVKVN